MREVRTCFLVLFLFAIACFFRTSQAHAAALTNASIRLDRHKTATSPGNILITITPTTASTEDAFQVTFGSGWSIQSSPGVFTVSTSSLPASVTAWPGIGTATTVSGQTVTFPSNNLNVGTSYGFFLTGGVPTNPATAGTLAIYQIDLSTKSAGSSIDTATVDVPLVSNDQVVITAQILPPLSDFSAVLSTASDITEIPQDTTIEYLITYGSTYHSSQPVTLTADWSFGTIEGSGTPSVDLLEYVASSATDAYGSTAPVIDVEGRTITWTINSFPGNTTDQTVSFSLKTTDAYSGGLSVTATTAARITNPVSTTDSTSTTTYVYYAPPGSSSSGGSSESSGTSTSSNATTTTTTAQESPATTQRFLGYSLRNITHEVAEYFVTLAKPGTVSAYYGTSPTSLTSTLYSATPSTYHHVSLSNLLPNTRYYVRFTTTGSAGGETTSELLTFTTTSKSELLEVTKVTLFSEGLHIVSYPGTQTPSLLIPKDSPLEYTIELLGDTPGSALSLQLEKDGQSKYGSTLTQTQPGTWTGKLVTLAQQGTYSVLIVWKTPTGGKQTTPIGTVRITEPITVLDAKTGNPIERARVRIGKYNQATRLYAPLETSNSFNTRFTTLANGTIPLVLSPGKYLLTVEALGYSTKEQVLDSIVDETFPQILLTPESFPYLSSFYYHLETALLKIELLLDTLREEAQSSATIRLLTLLTISITTPLTLLGILAQSHFSLSTFFHSLYNRHTFILGKGLGGHRYKQGKITTNNKGVRNAVVTISDALGRTKLVLQTHRAGELAIPEKYLEQGTTLSVFSPGFASKTLALEPTTEPFSMELEAQTTKHSIGELSKKLITHLLTQATELNLAVSLTVSVLFTFVYGSTEAVPFLAISTLNAAVYVHTQLSAYLHMR